MANDPRRGMAWRAAWLVMIVLSLVLWRSSLGGPSYIVQIEFGMDPEYLTGAEVVIDGEVRGTLERYGARTVNGFEVDEGDHTVEVRKEGCNADTARITAGFGGTTLRIMAGPDSDYRGTESVCVIRLEY